MINPMKSCRGLLAYLLAAGCLLANLFIRAITQPSLFVTGSAM